MERTVRVRFAPSPTGALHIGGVRTALFNYLFAKKNNGKFFIRIEDTDQTRFVADAEAYIYEALEWLGLNPDESPKIGGEFSPYKQSERKEMYRQYADKLIEKDSAYYAFDTTEEIEAMKVRLETAGSKNPSYNAISREQMKNSLTFSQKETEDWLASGKPYVIRFKTPLKEEIRFKDLIRDWVKVHSTQLDDKVLLKSDGMPTYHLANVVDDYLMQTTHVIRGEEWLPSAPLHVLLYQHLGWENEMPQFAHLPLILNPDGKGKLSKRKGKEYGFPVFPLDWQDAENGETLAGFRESGYLPEAVLNFLALLGWNPGTEQEIFSLDELIQSFSLERIHLAGAKFDIEKAKWYNQQYIKKTKNEDLLIYLKESLQQNGIDESNFDDEQLLKIVAITKDRVHFPQDLWKEAIFIFQKPTKYDENTIAKKWNEQAAQFVRDFGDALANFSGDWTSENIHHVLQNLIDAKGAKFGQVMPAVRVALTGLGSGLDLMIVIELIGKAETLERFQTALEKIGRS